MSTRSTIAIQNEDGSVEGVYCHSDGYLSYNGKLLFEHFTDESKIRALIALGGISSLCADITCPNGHTFDNPVEGFTRVYHRDRGEDLEIYKGLNYIEFYLDMNQEYNYLWADGQWWLATNGTKKVSLEAVLNSTNDE